MREIGPFTVMVCFVALLGCVVCWEPAAGQYVGSPNVVRSIDFRDGTLAVTTDSGLFLMRGGRIMRFAHGIRLETVVLEDGNTMFVGPVGPFKASFYKAELVGEELVITDITQGREDMPCDVNAVVLGHDGCLWAGYDIGLARFDGRAWETYEWPWSDVHTVMETRLCVDSDGAIWGIVCCPHSHLFKFQDGLWTNFDLECEIWAIGMDREGRIVAISFKPPGLWRFEEDAWALISDDPGWGCAPDNPSSYTNLEVDYSGVLWAFEWRDLGKYDGETLLKISEICGINKFFIHCAKALYGSTVLFGTNGYGLFVFEGESFSRICAPSD